MPPKIPRNSQKVLVTVVRVLIHSRIFGDLTEILRGLRKNPSNVNFTFAKRK